MKNKLGTIFYGLILAALSRPALADVAGSIQGGTDWLIVVVQALGAIIVIVTVFRMWKGHFHLSDALAAIGGFVVATNPGEVLAWIN